MTNTEQRLTFQTPEITTAKNNGSTYMHAVDLIRNKGKLTRLKKRGSEFRFYKTPAVRAVINGNNSFLWLAEEIRETKTSLVRTGDLVICAKIPDSRSVIVISKLKREACETHETEQAKKDLASTMLSFIGQSLTVNVDH